jgi:transglutaminase-like putative cysteine protease
MKSLSFCLVFLFFGIPTVAQKIEYSVLSIPDSLKQNANAVVRLEQTDIHIKSRSDMTISNKNVVTFFNEQGWKSMAFYENYSRRTSIRNISATILDAFGNENKKLKRKDFKDQSTAEGYTIYSDYRVLYLVYTPTNYPFTIVYESEIGTSNTAFIPSWNPIGGAFVSVEKSIFNIIYPADCGFKKMESNFTGYQILATVKSPISIAYTATNFPANRREEYSQDRNKIFPMVRFGLDLFQLEGVEGNATTWKDFGLWYNQKILPGTTDISELAKAKIKEVVGSETDPIKKARLVYEYMQQKSRYVNITIGIGGWKPMPAEDVDRLGYGDCKALTNYTKSLLDAVGVTSYHTILYGGLSKSNIDTNFVSMQGNHMILCVPNGNDYVWLECTSQDNPFGYQANFTDDRNVLILKPDGGEIARTKIYTDKVNSQISKGSMMLSEIGDLSGNISIVSEGSQYGMKQRVETMQPIEREAHYKDYWSNINSLKINKATYANDKEKVRFTENMEITAINYGNLSGSRMMFALNGYNQHSTNVRKIRNRKTPFEILRGSYDEDEIQVALPVGFAIEALPNNIKFSGKFGEYKTEIIKVDGQNLVYKRSFFVKEGVYASNEYEDFRLFMEQVSRNDNAKIVLLKKQ